MDHRVEGFPFNILRDPMYVGSTLCFVAGALWYGRPAGLVISAFVYIAYIIALQFEGCVKFSSHCLLCADCILCRPFTDKIYSARENAKSKKA
jgi:phosphatidylethanolamine N-methyltransferase